MTTYDALLALQADRPVAARELERLRSIEAIAKELMRVMDTDWSEADDDRREEWAIACFARLRRLLWPDEKGQG